ncbi:MAG: DivIVA domain-containing protein [Clostridia bacterium]|nr:DivIVA domain-containing protein [Clostridia bacterium]
MITASEIKSATFGRAGRGYKTTDVDVILDKAAETIEKLTADNAALLSKLEILAEKVQEYRNDEDTIRNALLTAQRSADQIMKEANANAEAITAETQRVSDEALSAAKKKAEEMLYDAQEKSVAIVNETREKATAVMNEAKDKADNMLKEAQENCRIEFMQLEATKKQAAEFRAALMDMYRQQFELMKKGPEVEYVPEAKEEPEIAEEPSVAVVEDVEEEIADREANFVSPEDIPLPIASKPFAFDEEDGVEDGFSLNLDQEDL